MKTLTATVIIGTIAALIGIYVFARDEITSRLFPEMKDASVSDVRTITEETSRQIREVVVQNSISEEEISQIVLSEDDIERIVTKAFEDVSQNAQENGRTIGPSQAVAFVGAATDILESNEPGTKAVREALANEAPSEAAALLVKLAEEKSSSPDTPNNQTSEIWETAGAILYPIDAVKSSAAYNRAASLSPDNDRLATLSKQIEAELRERESEQAPDAVRRLSSYSGPIQPFGTSVTKGTVTIEPTACTGQEMDLKCNFDLSFDGDPRRIDIRGIRLVDDWSRIFIPSRTQLSERWDDDGSVAADLNAGTHSLEVDFENVPGGSNYGVQFEVDRHIYYWRGIPTETLDASLRDDWGGPLGIASFRPFTETISEEPYAIRLTGCERFGKDVRCYGYVGYAGPKQRLTLKDVVLVDDSDRQYKAVFSRLAFSADNDNSVYADLVTGEHEIMFRFYGVPFTGELRLRGSLNNDASFEFQPFEFDVDEEDVARISYFYDFPLRLNAGSSLRFEDFKVSPKGCERDEFTAICDVELLYVGEKRRIHFDWSYLIDNDNNYYPAVHTQILGTNYMDDDNSLFADLSAGRYVLRQAFESLPPARLFEQRFRLDQSASVYVTNLTLRGADGRMGIPTDIRYTEINDSKRIGSVEVTTDGCARRGKDVDCFLHIIYDGPHRRIAIDQIRLESGSGTISATHSTLAGSSDNDDSMYRNLYSGTYASVVRFKDVPANLTQNLALRVNGEKQYNWTKSVMLD